MITCTFFRTAVAGFFPKLIVIVAVPTPLAVRTPFFIVQTAGLEDSNTTPELLDNKEPSHSAFTLAVCPFFNTVLEIDREAL